MIFLFGTLLDAQLRKLVLGQAVAAQPAHLADHAVAYAGTTPYPTLYPSPDTRAEGALISASGDALARMDWFEALFGFERRPVDVIAPDGERVAAEVYWPPAEGPAPGAHFDIAEWIAEHGAVTRAAAAHVMSMRGDVPDPVIRKRWTMILVRAQAWLNAARGHGPTTLRRKSAPDDVEVERLAHGYADFFAVEDYVVRHKRFNGAWSEPLSRAAFVMGDAIVALPYDPAQDTVLIVEQFRTGNYARGEPEPWSLEAIAGRIDPGETPQEAARREAQEEAGLALQDLIQVPMGYPSPGAVTEYLYAFIALCPLQPGAPGLGGAEGEGEDIRSHVIPFARLLELIDSGEVNTTPLIALALHLERMRASLRAAG